MIVDIEVVEELVRIAVAPVFLVLGVSNTLMVLIHRLARIVDRGRALEATGVDLEGELPVLGLRAKLAYRAMVLCVCAALSVCILMTAAFAGLLMDWSAGFFVAALFLLALFLYSCALLCLLREVFLAVGSFSLGLKTAGRR